MRGEIVLLQQKRKKIDRVPCMGNENRLLQLGCLLKRLYEMDKELGGTSQKCNSLSAANDSPAVLREGSAGEIQ